MDAPIPHAGPDGLAAPPGSIFILLDDQPHEVAAGTTLADLLAELGHGESSVATAVNSHFVARGLRRQYFLRSGDKVLLFQPIVAG